MPRVLKVLRPALCCALLLVASGCIHRNIDRRVFSQGDTEILLRLHKRGFTPVERGYEHPFTISAVRAAHILSRIDMRKEEGGASRRTPAIPTESLYLIGEGLSKAFAEASENEEIVVLSIRRTKRLGIFDREYLTSFVTFRKDDMIQIHLGLSDWEVPPSREERLPQPRADGGNDRYRLMPGSAMSVVGPAALAVAWRDPIFSKPTRTRVTPSGRVVRREILMESPEEAPEEAPAPALLPTNLSPQTLRALADLEDARLRGEVTEAEYQVRRQGILESDPGDPGAP